MRYSIASVVLVSSASLSLVPQVHAQTEEPVRVTEDASTWRLSNGLVELTIDKKQATLTHLSVPGGPELVSLGYYDTNGRPGGHKNAGYLRFGRHEPVIAEIAQRSDDLVDVMLRSDPAQLKPDFHHALRMELHYVLRRGAPGFYVYWLRWHTSSMPAFDLAQTRHVMKCPRSVFDRWQITDKRKGVFPTEAEVKAAKRAYDATIQLSDGRYLTKYANAVAADGHHLSGLYSSEHRLGLWQINASSEYINGGPTKQNLTIHESVPYVLHMVHSGHFGGRSIYIEGQWCKAYGPIFIYLRQGGSMEEQWEAAKRRVGQEQSKWPYPWVKLGSVPDAYPLERGTVTGRLQREDNGSPANALVVLGASEPELQFQGLGYMLWSRVAADGTFRIPKVRPGTYTLHAFQAGVFGDAQADGVTVEPGRETNVGSVRLAPKTTGRLLWQIGTSDRTAAEYRHGDDFRQVYLHKRYPEDFPNDVRFVIGKSKEALDWNYHQPGGRRWEVIFRMQRRPEDNLVLTIAVAGFSYSPPVSIAVGVNGKDVGTLRLGRGDSALWRLGIYDVYRVETVNVPGEHLQVGENVLSLTLPHSRMWVMYDFLRMETRE